MLSFRYIFWLLFFEDAFMIVIIVVSYHYSIHKHDLVGSMITHQGHMNVILSLYFLPFIL